MRKDARAQAPPPTTQSAIVAIRETAAEFGHAIAVEEEIGNDDSSAGLSVDRRDDADNFFSHEAFIRIGGRPAIEVCLYDHDEARVGLDGVEFDVPRDSVPAFPHAVWSGLVHVKTRVFPPSGTLIVTLPGEPSYREPLLSPNVTPWLVGLMR
ncbi:hypothetical protein [Streptomyces sp. NPDC090021]|uniref:hypothetical protein n=1 Tax=Streptomyces sp. NPDC090021 TaxID=3365919 RepID=UPI00382EB69C